MVPAGNQGPGCGTVLTPASYAGVIGVGATDRAGQLATFSGRGPGQGAHGRLPLTQFPLEKPNWVAPGDSIRAAHSDHDLSYMIFSGTHLSAGITAGAVALVLSAAPGLQFQHVTDIIRTTLSSRPPAASNATGQLLDTSITCNFTAVGKFLP